MRIFRLKHAPPDLKARPGKFLQRPMQMLTIHPLSFPISPLLLLQLSLLLISMLLTSPCLSPLLLLLFSLTYNHPIIVNANVTSYSNQINIDSSHIVNWDKVTEDDSINYCDYVRNHLPDIPEELVSCCNPNCSTQYH